MSNIFLYVIYFGSEIVLLLIFGIIFFKGRRFNLVVVIIIFVLICWFELSLIFVLVNVFIVFVVIDVLFFEIDLNKFLFGIVYSCCF